MVNMDYLDISYVSVYFMSAVRGMSRSPQKKRNTLVAIAILMVLWINRYNFFYNRNEALANLRRISLLIFIILVSIVIWMAKCGVMIRDIQLHNEFVSAGFTNSKAMPPILVDCIKEGCICRLVFNSKGISLDKWKNKKDVIENVLDMTINSIEKGKNNKEIVVIGVNGKAEFAEVELASVQHNCEGEVCIGNGLFGTKKVNLNISPHILIGGSTGSGKTFLLKCILIQLYQQNATIYLADFKGGVDFPRIFWDRKVSVLKEIEEVEFTLSKIINELEDRKQLFEIIGCKNIVEYNNQMEELNEDKLKRTIFACDELAELLDKTGLTKEEKTERDCIVKQLSKIARLGRAFGIHLILSTQRPDAEVVPGQIKNNIDMRICGRADSVLSTIILGNGDADDNIPKNSQGLFLDNNGEMFKGFIIDESCSEYD